MVMADLLKASVKKYLSIFISVVQPKQATNCRSPGVYVGIPGLAGIPDAVYLLLVRLENKLFSLLNIHERG